VREDSSRGVGEVLEEVWVDDGFKELVDDFFKCGVRCLLILFFLNLG
jgi:hypothetical protein